MEDQRIVKTRQALYQALAGLLKEKCFAERPDVAPRISCNSGNHERNHGRVLPAAAVRREGRCRIAEISVRHDGECDFRRYSILAYGKAPAAAEGNRRHHLPLRESETCISGYFFCVKIDSAEGLKWALRAGRCDRHFYGLDFLYR